MKIRNVVESDLEIINLFLNDMNMLFFDKDSISLNHRYLKMLECNEKPIGLLVFNIIVDEAEIEAIYVIPEERKKGFSKVLIDYLIEDCVNKKCVKIFLEVNEKNDVAISLYKSYDFKIISTREKYYGNDNALIMCKELGD